MLFARRTGKTFRLMSGRRLGSLTVVATGTFALVAVAVAAPKHHHHSKIPVPRARPIAHHAPSLFSPAPLSLRPSAFEAKAVVSTAALASAPPEQIVPLTAANTTSAADVELVKRAADLIAHNKFSGATDVRQQIHDPLARKFVEWMILRGDENHSPGFERYASFVVENPSWPSVGLLRKRAEAALWDNKRDGTTVLSYFAKNAPLTAKGKFSYARALLARGDLQNAERQVRDGWQHDAFSATIESMVRSEFAGMVRPADDRIRMRRRLYAEDTDAGLRAAERLGDADRALAKAWIAVNQKSSHAKALLDDVPESMRHDAGYLFARTRWLRRADKIAEAGRLLLANKIEPSDVLDTNEWWVERRLLARKLLDINDPQSAYRIVRDAAVPAKNNYRVDREFTAGWIALRFLSNPTTAMQHFSSIPRDTTNPTALARAGYWQGRTAEALGHSSEARTFYSRASRYRTTYYGQLARARIGEGQIALQAPPTPTAERRAVLYRTEVVRALSLVYAAGLRDIAIPIVADVADRSSDVGVLVAMAEVAQHNRDARAMLLIGKAALHHGFSFEHYAFPTIGVPSYKPIGPEIDASVLYSIVRQESAFNAKTVSSANAYGLMQVTADAGRYIAKKFGVTFNRKRLLDDIVYNVQMGAAELGDLIRDYRGSYILTFAGYNAGRGRVREWIARYGDPRNPNVDPVDWVEMIPFSETRNYVQRILENMQVYRARFGSTHRLMIEADLRRGTEAN
jgi:soluble lytic murein transglycosylase